MKKLIGTVAVSCLAVVSFVAVPSPAGAEGVTPGGRYVALGDSYSADSGVLPLTPGTNPVCLQSSRNYPKQVAAALGLSLTDVTCGGATVSHMTKAQYPKVPAQFDALDGAESVVTLGIGGNDNNLFASAIALCGVFAPIAILNLGAPCKQTYGDKFDKLIDSDAVNIGAAIDGIHQRSPNAMVYVVGYLDILPQTGRCYAQLPLTSGDVTYLNAMEKHVNQMLAEQAAGHDAVFVDTFTPSIGHDACKPPAVRWIEPPLSGQPIHPGLAGAAAQARIVGAALTG